MTYTKSLSAQTLSPLHRRYFEPVRQELSAVARQYEYRVNFP
jgi:hypothetical protein